MRCDTLGHVSRNARAAARKLATRDDPLEGFELAGSDVRDTRFLSFRPAKINFSLPSGAGTVLPCQSGPIAKKPRRAGGPPRRGDAANPRLSRRAATVLRIAGGSDLSEAPRGSPAKSVKEHKRKS